MPRKVKPVFRPSSAPHQPQSDHNNRGDHRPQWTLATLVPGPGIHWPMGGYLSAEMMGLTVRYLFSHGPLCFRLFYMFPNTCFLLEIESLDGCESRRRLNQDHIRLYSPWYLPKPAPQGLTGHRTGAGGGGNTIICRTLNKVYPCLKTPDVVARHTASHHTQ